MAVISGMAATAGLGLVPTADGQSMPQQDCSHVIPILVVEEQETVSFIDGAAMNSDGRVIITATQFGDPPFGENDVTRILEWDLDDPNNPADPTVNVRLATDDEDVQFLRYIFSATINDFNDIIFSGFSDTTSDTWNAYGLAEGDGPSELAALLDFSKGQPTLLGELSLLNNPPADRRFVYWTETSVNGVSEFCITLFEDGSTEDLVCTTDDTEIGRLAANDAGDVYYRQRETPENAARAPLSAGRRQAAQAQNDIEQTIKGLTAEDDEVTLCPLPLSQGLLTGPSVNSAGNVAFFASGPCSPGDPDEGGIYFYDAAAGKLQLVVDFEEVGLLPTFEIRRPFLNDANRIAFVARDAADPAIHSIYIYNPANDPEDRVIQLNDEALPDFQRIILGYVAVGDDDRVLYLGRNGQGQQTLFLATGCEVTINPDPCPADLNGDGVVDIDDLFILLANWSDPGEQCSDCDNCVGDLNDSCSVDVDDLFILLAAWGDCPVTACGQPQAGSCCSANDTPYCDDDECCSLICDIDPFCCDTAWDSICAGEANEMCAVCDPCPADLNGDSVVDIDDLFILLGAWGPCDDPDDCPADLDGNGEVDIDDLFELLAAWGDCPVTACGQPQVGGCCEANDTPYCDDAECCELVCAEDASCCDVAWDSLCVDHAVNLCNVCPSECTLLDWDISIGQQGIEDGPVNHLAVFDGVLFAAGWFNSAGGQPAPGLAWWDGVQWNIPTFIDDLLKDVVVGNRELFLEVSALSTVEDVESDLSALVFALFIFFDDDDFETIIAGVTSLNDDPFVLGVANGYVNDLEFFFEDGDGMRGTSLSLYISGDFTEVDGLPMSLIARFDGSDWSSPFDPDFDLGDVIGDPTLRAFFVHDDGGGEALYFVYNAVIDGLGLVNLLAKWDGNEVTPIGYTTGVGSIFALEEFEGKLLVGGSMPDLFAFDPDTGEPAHVPFEAGKLAFWDGATWSEFGPSPTFDILSFTIFDDGTGAALYAGARVALEGDTFLVLRWDGEQWVDLNDSGPHNLLSGFSARIRFAVYDDGFGEALYVAGNFDTIFVNVDHDQNTQSGQFTANVNQIAAYRCLDHGIDFSCGNPILGNCCVGTLTPYCDDPVCCEQVCAAVPFCCDVVWDSSCAAEANRVCNICR